MSTKVRFLVYAPDMTDEGAFDRRMSVRTEHLEVIKANIQSGVIRVGAVLLDSADVASESKKFVGSMLICEGKSLEEVRKLVESDVYYTSNVWDKDKIVIHPCLVATPEL